MTQLQLIVAGIAVRVYSGSRVLLEQLARRYRGFTGEAAGAPFEVRVTPDSGSEHRFHAAPAVGFSGDRLTFDLPGYRGTIDPNGSAELEIASPAPVHGTDYFLRVVYSLLAYRSGGLLLHAAGVVRKGRAYLFFGRSGSGKTTVARNAGDSLVLNDDLIVLLPADDGWSAFGTPFTNATQTAPSGGSAPAAALLRLVQSPTVRIEPLTGGRALAELMACVPVLNASPAPPLERCRELLLAVPAFDLHLLPDPSFWEAIERLEV